MKHTETNKTAQHTAGPWRIQESKRPITAEAGSLVIIEANALIQSPAFDSSARANAKLIAAAPDLLTALKSIIFEADTTDCGDEYIELTRENIAKARAAIAKATK